MRRIRPQSALVFMLAVFGCNRPKSSTDTVVDCFLRAVKDGDYAAARPLVCRRFRQDTSEITYWMKTIHDRVAKYDISPKDKWRIGYDTTSGIGGFKKYGIPLYSKSDSEKYCHGVIHLWFDYSGRLIGDSILLLSLSVDDEE